eukprot:m.158811 g.158811  ORF g.158811 m.158811 type:complete len:58 (+) comp31108_c0_seq16:1223-1396(+)
MQFRNVQIWESREQLHALQQWTNLNSDCFLVWTFLTSIALFCDRLFVLDKTDCMSVI